MVAVPDFVSQALPTIAESSQYAALVLQNTTSPAVTGVAPETTDAVSVTAVPAGTLLDDAFSVAAVGLAGEDCAHPAGPALRINASPNKIRLARKTREPLIRNPSSSMNLDR